MSALAVLYGGAATVLLGAGIGDVNNIAGVIGGAILCLELIGLLLVLVAINGGLAFGLRWVLGKMGFVHEKTNWALGLVDRYVNKGMNIIAAPVIVGTGAWRGLKAGLHRLTHWPASARPVLPASSGAAGPAQPSEPPATPGSSRAA